jgi:hypothetical protein
MDRKESTIASDGYVQCYTLFFELHCSMNDQDFQEIILPCSS